MGQTMGRASAGRGQELRWAWPPARAPGLYNPLCHRIWRWVWPATQLDPGRALGDSRACGQRVSRQGRAAFETQTCVCLSPELAFFSLPCSPRLEKAGCGKASFQKLLEMSKVLGIFGKAECVALQKPLNRETASDGGEAWGVRCSPGGEAHGDYGLE